MMPSDVEDLAATRDVVGLIRALGEPNTRIRVMAAMALGGSAGRDVRAVGFLMAALKDASEDVRREAAKALGRYDDLQELGPLIAALTDVSEDVRREAATALGKRKDPRIVEQLIVALEHENVAIRGFAARLLGERREPGAIEALTKALDDKSDEVRLAAAIALDEAGAPRAIDAFIGALRHQDAAVRRQAADALAHQRDPRAVDALAAALEDRDDIVRHHAVIAVTKKKEPQSVDQLLKLITSETIDYVWSAAVEALRTIGDPRAIPPLIAILMDKSVSTARRGEVAKALAGLGVKDAMDSFKASMCRRWWYHEDTYDYDNQFGETRTCGGWLDRIRGASNVEGVMCAVCRWAGILCTQCRRGVMTPTRVNWEPGKPRYHYDPEGPWWCDFGCGYKVARLPEPESAWFKSLRPGPRPKPLPHD